MADVQELVVRATPEGVDTVTSEVDGMSESIEDSGEQMDEAADSFGNLQKKFAGAGAAIAGAFAATTGLLLGRVPILTETLDSFGILFDTLGLKIDSLLRGALTTFNNFILNLSETVGQADGPLGNLVGLISLLATSALGAITAFASFKIATVGIVAGLKATGGAILTVLGYIGSFIASIISLPVLLAAAGVAVLALAYIYRDELISAFHDAIDWLGAFGSKVKSAGKTALKRAGKFVSNLGDKFSGLVAKAKEWGKDLIKRLIAGIKNKAAALQSTVSGINLTAGVTIGDVTGSVSSGVEAGTEAASDFIGSGGTINLDGRDVENNQGRLRKSNLNRR